MKIRDASSALRTVSRIRIRDAAGALQSVKTISIRDASNVLRTVASISAVSGTASPNPVYGSGRSSSPITIATQNTVVTVNSGSPPYTYSWATAAGPQWSAIAPTQGTTGFRCNGVPPEEVYVADFVCTITDSAGTVGTATVQARVSNTYRSLS